MTPANWLIAAILAIAIGVVGPALDNPLADDHSADNADWPSSTELQALQATERGTQRRQAAAQALCHAERGLQSEARWTPDGDLVCTQRPSAPANPATSPKVLEARL